MKKNYVCIKKIRPCFFKIIRFAFIITFLLTPHQGEAAWHPGQNLPFAVHMLLHEVKESMNQKDYQGAISKIIAFHKKDESASENPFEVVSCRHPMVCFVLGNCYLLKSDYQNAKTAYLKTLKNAPDFIDANLNLAKVYSETRNFQEASDCFLKAYNQSDPKHPDYIYYSAVSCLMGDKHEQAIVMFEKLFQAHPESIVLQWRENYANALVITGRTKQAIPVIRNLVTQTSGDDKIQWQETLLQIHLKMKNTDQALSYATELSHAHCSEAKWWKARIHIHLTLGQYNHALAELIIYGYLKPLSTEEKMLMADLCMQLEIPDKAARIYEILLTDKTDKKPDKQILQRMVSAYQQLGMPEKALSFMDRFGPKNADPELLMLKGDLMYSVKRFNEANAAYRMAAQKNFHQTGQAWLMAGYAAWQQNDLKASREAFQRAAGFKRHRKDAMAAIAQIERTKQM